MSNGLEKRVFLVPAFILDSSSSLPDPMGMTVTSWEKGYVVVRDAVNKLCAVLGLTRHRKYDEAFKLRPGKVEDAFSDTHLYSKGVRIVKAESL